MRWTLLLALLAGCASTPPLTATPGGRPLYVAVLPVHVAPGVVVSAPSTSTLGTILGASTPRDIVREDVVSGIASEGYFVQAPDVTLHTLLNVEEAALPPGEGARLAALASALGVDAVAEVELRAWDASHTSTQQRAVVDLVVTLVGRDGVVLWQGENDPKVVVVRTYRASADWRSYVHEAVDAALSTLP